MSRGVAEPKHLILPDGIVASGWPAVRDTSARVGILYDPWQQDLNRAMLAKDADGLYAADTVGLSLCRQSGKTYDVGGVTFADSIIHPGTTTVWTAHRFKVARETFNELKALASSPKMSPHVDPEAITTAAGNECIPFRNGSRIVFAARERGAIRGFTKVRRLVLDEAQILTESAMSDLVPTTNHAWNPQIILMGTPPKPTDPGDVFANLRQEALEGRTVGVLWCEFGADPGADPDSWEAVAQANPSFPKRTSKRAVLRLRKLLPSDDDYAREALGIWGASVTKPVIDPDLWLRLADGRSKPGEGKTFAVDVPPDRQSASIAVASWRPDGRLHVEVVDHRPGTLWVAERAAQLDERWQPNMWLLDPSGPAGQLIVDMTQAGVAPKLVGSREMAAACGRFVTLAESERLVHIGQEPLTLAVDGARKRTLGDAWAWHRRDASVDLSPLVAVTLAVHGVDQESKKRRKTGRAMFVG